MREKKQFISVLLSFFIFAASLLGGPKIELRQQHNFHRAEWVKSDSFSLKAILEKDVKSFQLDQVRSDHVPGSSVINNPHPVFSITSLDETDLIRNKNYNVGAAIATQNLRKVLFPFHSHW